MKFRSMLILLCGIRLSTLASSFHIEISHLSTQQGLSENTVNTIFQDSYGLIWLGTRSGLNQYDGYSFKTFYHDPHDSSSISGNYINAIAEDDNGILWIGTDVSGLNAYDRHSNTFHRYQIPSDSTDQLNENTIMCLYVDQQNRLWIGSEFGLTQYHSDTETFTTYFPNDMIRTIFEETENIFWMGTNNGVIKWNLLTNQWTRYQNQANDPLSLGSDLIQDIVMDSSQQVWVATIDGGLNWYHREKDRFFCYKHDEVQSPVLTTNSIYCLHVDSEGGLWAGFENAGLQKINVVPSINSEKPQIFLMPVQSKQREEQTFQTSSVLNIFEDLQGNFWVGTYWEGLYYICRSKKQFQNYHSEPLQATGLSHDHVHCFLEDPQSNIWIGTDGGGLNYFNRSNNSFTYYKHEQDNPGTISSDHVLDMCFDEQSNLWLATWDGLNYMDVEKKVFHQFRHKPNDPENLSSDKVMCVHLDQSNRLWVGTINGLNLMMPGYKSFQHRYSGDGSVLSNSYIHSIFEDVHGNIWVATAWGLFYLDHKDLLHENYYFKQYVHSKSDLNSLSENRIYTVYEDSHDQIWITTINGLNLFDPQTKQFQRFTTQDGLATNWVSSIIEDRKGYFWLGTLHGISRFDYTNKMFINYDMYDGLGSSEYGTGVYRCLSGELLFGGKNGFTLFDPDSIKANTYVPPVVLTDIQIFNRSVPISEILAPHTNFNQHDSIAIELNHSQKVLSFEFAALDYSSPEKNQYQFKLEGFDTDWRRTDASRRFVTYTNLREGRYLFKVKGSNSDGVWNEHGLQVELRVKPPFWRTPWALLFYFILIVMILLAARELVVYREKLKNEMELERKEAERIHALDVMKLRFFTNVSHEFRTPLTLIIGMLERMHRTMQSVNRKELQKSVLMIHNNARKLLYLINQIMDIRKLDDGGMTLQYVYRDIIPFVKAIFSAYSSMAEQRHIDYRFKSKEISRLMAFDPDKIEKMVNNLLSNAFKFTPDNGRIDMNVAVVPVPIGDENKASLKREADFNLQIEVKDTGIGISKEHIQHIFDPFFQVDHDHNQPRTGTGIGLALTNELVQLHQGMIHVESQLHKGTSFILQIPILKKIDADLVDQGLSAYEPHVPVAFVAPEAKVQHARTADLEVPTVLIVDDDVDFCIFLKSELEDEYHVVLAYDGEQALELINEDLPDLIVTDIRMPKLSGFELCDAIKSQDRTSHIPIIMLTSQTNIQSKLQGYNYGADGYVEKPFEIQLLRNRITNLLVSQKRLKEKFSHEIYLEPKGIAITSEDERFLTHVIETIDAQIDNVEFGVKELGESIGFSRVQLYRKIKALTELTPTELLRTMRLKRGAQLLNESQLTISEIAYRTGFKEVSYFCKCFKDHYGVSPAVFAKSK